MRPTVTDRGAWSLGVSVGLSVSLSVCHTIEPAKAAEPIHMPFGLRTRVGPGNHIQILHWKGQFLGKGRKGHPTVHKV